MDLRQTCPIDVKAQARVDSELVLWREWADNDERTELLPCPLLEPVVLANKRADRPPTRGASDQGGIWRDSSGMVDARGGEQLCLGSAQQRLWACPAYRETRFDLPPTHQHQGEDCDWRQTQVGEKA